MMTRWIIGFTLLLINFTFAKEYDLQQVLQLAEKNNIAIRLAQTDIKVANAEKLAAISTALPQIDVDGGYNRNFKKNLFFFTATNPETGLEETQSFQTSFNNEFQLTAMLKQTLFSFEVGYALQAAKRLNKFSEHNLENVRQLTVTLTKQAFHRILLQEEVARVAEASEKSAKDNYDNIKIKFDAGTVSEFELLQAEVRWQNTIPETIRAKKDHEQALNALKILVGVPITEEMALSGKLGDIPPMPERPDVQNVLAERPDYNAMVWQRKLQETNMKVQRARYFPRLEGTLRYSYAATSDEFKLEQENDNIVLGLSLNIPIFSGGFNASQVRKAKAEIERVDIQLREKEDNIHIDLENIYLQLQETRQRIDAADRAAHTARRAFEIAETRVQNGLSTQVELKDSRVALDEAQVNYYSAIYGYLAAYFDWQYATGQL